MTMTTTAKTVQIPTKKLLQVLEDNEEFGKIMTLSDEEKAQKSYPVVLQPANRAILLALLATNLTPKQKETIRMSIGTPEQLLDTEVDSPEKFGEILQALLREAGKPTFSVVVAGKWYPVATPTINVGASFFGTYCNFYCQYVVCGTQMQNDVYISRFAFVADDGRTVLQRKVSEVLEQYGVRYCSEQDIEEYERKMGRVEKLNARVGIQMACTSYAYQPERLWWKWIMKPIRVGSEKMPGKVVIEPELEVETADVHPHHRDTAWVLPFVRAFSLEHKQYAVIDIDDLKEYEYRQNSLDSLVVPGDMGRVIRAVFDAQGVFGDMFHGRHGGMVVLANGPSGVGKTLTAEVFSEHMKRPLYSLEMGELGTDLAGVEQALRRIFERAARWNAVLLFDEADIFLAKRTETDLERSAIVGVFLRLLDYYQGMFFLTTNRADVIDPAFQSRVTLRLDYPPLSQEARVSVWKKMAKSAGLDLRVQDSHLGEHDLNGREIRNQIRLLSILAGKDRVVDDALLSQSIRYVARSR